LSPLFTVYIPHYPVLYGQCVLMCVFFSCALSLAVS